MGTMVGGDGPGPFTPDPGVAPGAQWIAAKGCEDLGCSELSLLSSGQFMLAPTDLDGENPDPSKRPDIVNNSWGGGPGDTFYLETVQAWRAAGIIPVFCSGNPGPFCGEGGSPGDFHGVLQRRRDRRPGRDRRVLRAAARPRSARSILTSAAPGVDVVSSVPGGGYEAFCGTSMAAPHVAGTLALMLSAEPALRGDFDGRHRRDPLDRHRPPRRQLRRRRRRRPEQRLRRRPHRCQGRGRPRGDRRDACPAPSPMSPPATRSRAPRITANDGTRDFSAVTDTNGDYDLFLAAGTYLVTAQAFGYAAGVTPGVVIVTDQTTDSDFALAAAAPLHRHRPADRGRGRLAARGRHVSRPWARPCRRR